MCRPAFLSIIPFSSLVKARTSRAQSLCITPLKPLEAAAHTGARVPFASLCIRIFSPIIADKILSGFTNPYTHDRRMAYPPGRVHALQ